MNEPNESGGGPRAMVAHTALAVAPAPAVALPASCKIWGDVGAKPPAVSGGVARTNVKATYHYYSPQYETSSLACADAFWADPANGKKLLKYPWTAYCLDGKSFVKGTCGKCLRVTNRATRASIVARAVDFGGCSDVDGTGLDLDPCAFNALDTDKRGYADGSLRVDVQEVECGADGTFGRPAPKPKPTPRPPTPRPTPPRPAGPTAMGPRCDPKAALAMHNSWRAKYGRAPLVWDDALARSAKRKTDSCVFNHKGLNSLNGVDLGENLAWGNPTYECAAAIDDWTKEESRPDPPPFNHATQTLWRSARKVGCALTPCKAAVDAPRGQGDLIACHYDVIQG
jgi:hypothetical protein